MFPFKEFGHIFLQPQTLYLNKIHQYYIFGEIDLNKFTRSKEEIEDVI